MRSPVLPAAKIATTVLALLEDPAFDVDQYLEWSGSGVELDLAGLEDAVTELRDEHEEFVVSGNLDLDIFEGRVAARLHAELTRAGAEPGALDEPGFWAALTFRHFWWFVHWRQQSTFDGGDYGKYRKYVDGTNWSECVVLRSYLRGRLVYRSGDPDPYRLATAIPNGADFWRSHVLRVQTSMSSSLSQALAEEQATDRMSTNELRSYARRLNRLWSNVVMHVYNADECRAVIRELR